MSTLEYDILFEMVKTCTNSVPLQTVTINFESGDLVTLTITKYRNEFRLKFQQFYANTSNLSKIFSRCFDVDMGPAELTSKIITILMDEFGIYIDKELS